MNPRILPAAAAACAALALFPGCDSAPVVVAPEPNVAPSTIIRFPDGNAYIPRSTPETFRVSWEGTDPDGTGGPVEYKFRLVTGEEITTVPGIAASPAQIEAFFGADAPGFAGAGWDSVPGDSTGHVLTGLTDGVRYYLAVVAVDEDGAHDANFDQETNVLHFQPTSALLGPRITIGSDSFSYSQAFGGVFDDPAHIVHIDHPAATTLTLHWSALPVQGGFVLGYRQGFDLVDILDETPPVLPGDPGHWGPWSPDTTVVLGPFPPGEPEHFFYLEARDDFGLLSLVTIGIRTVTPVATRHEGRPRAKT